MSIWCGILGAAANWRLRAGARYPADVQHPHAGIDDPDADAAGVREEPIREQDPRRRRPPLEEQRRVPGTPPSNPGSNPLGRFACRPAGNNGPADANLIGTAGDDELLEADYARHVVFQGGELPRGQEATLQLHGGVPGGKLPGARPGPPRVHDG